MSETVIAIPARFAAQRFPGKPLALLHGRPMIAWVVEQALRAGLGPVIVATDHDGIAAAAHAAGAEPVMTPAELPSGTDRVSFALRGRTFDVVVNLQGDEPCVDPGQLRRCAARLLSDPHAGMATLATPCASSTEFHDANVVKVVVNHAGHALYFSRAPVPFPRETPGEVAPQALRHLGLYAYRSHVLQRFVSLPPAPLELTEKLEQLRALHHGIAIAVEIVEQAARGVDTPADLEALAALPAPG